MFKKTLFAGAALLLSAGIASATTIYEIGDAGSTFDDAQAVQVGTTGVSGTLLNRNDQDIYGFRWGGGNLTIDLDGLTRDVQLFMFDAVGRIIGANDDGGPGTDSRLTGYLDAGEYYVAATRFNSDPLNAAGNDIEDTIGYGSRSTYQPGVCTGDCALNNWREYTNPGTGTDYVLTFSDPVDPITVAAVPLPAGMALLLGGIGAIGVAARRRKTTG